MERLNYKKINKFYESYTEMLQTRDEIIEIIKRENAELVEENKRLLSKVLELEEKRVD